MTPQQVDPLTLAHEQPEFLLAIITALMNKTGKTHIMVTSADVLAVSGNCALRFKSDDPSAMHIYLVTAPGEEHVGLDYADPVIAPDMKRLQ